jgi:hypothetical protein
LHLLRELKLDSNGILKGKDDSHEGKRQILISKSDCNSPEKEPRGSSAKTSNEEKALKQKSCGNLETVDYSDDEIAEDIESNEMVNVMQINN